MARDASSSALAAPPQPSSASIRLQLNRLLQSDQFKNSKRCRTLLSFLVEETLADRGSLLKERLVGIHVFARSADYDTGDDPVVRNAAIEVRKRLAQFYIESGRYDSVRIDLHSGTYVPEFRGGEEVFRLPEPEQHPAPSPALVPEPPIQSRRRIPLGFYGFALLAGLAAILLVRQLRNTWEPQPREPPPAAANAVVPASTAIPVTGDEAIRILVGKEQASQYVDRFGNAWLSDRYYTGGETKAGVTDFFFPPADPAFFRALRQGTFSYDIPLKRNQAYEMRLYFVEPQYRYGNRLGGDGENQRLFQIRANDQILLDRFDILRDAGFASTTVRAFKDIFASEDGKLHLRFIAQRDQPMVSAIELLPMNGHSIQPIRLHTSPSQYTDHSGNRWSPDNFYIGGQQFDSGASVTDTSDPDMLGVARLGNFSYEIPVPQGRYSLTLYFAETWYHEPGKRIFDVTCNGVLLSHALDVFREAGFSHVLRKTFHGLVPNGQGKLLLSFSPLVDYADVRALEITAE